MVQRRAARPAHARLNRLFLSAALALLMQVAAARAGYPDHPVTVVVPFPPGGSVDLVGRAMQPGFAAALGTGVVIVNQPGAGGTIGTARGAAARPDGYVLTLTTVGPLTTQPHFMKLAYGPDSFAPICRTHVTPQVLVVRADAPFHTLGEFVDYARGHRGAVSLASTGTGSVPHLATIEIGRAAGFEWLHVPNNGDGGALQLTLSGVITGWVAGVQTYAANAGSLRALGLLEAERLPDLPDVPTFREQGFDVVSMGWGGLLAPKGTPPEVLARLQDACAKAVNSPEMNRMLEHLQTPQGYLPAREFEAFVRAEYDRYGALISATELGAR